MSWPLVALSEVAAIFNGKTPSKKEQRDSGYPVLKIKDINEVGEFKGCFESYVDRELSDKFKSKQLKIDDTLVLNAAHNADYVGSKQYRVAPEVVGALPTGEWLIARADEKRLLPRFLNYWFAFPKTRFCIKFMVKGIHLYPKDIARLKIPLPPLAEQERIVIVLDKADAICRKREQAIQLADDFLRAVFLDIFGPRAHRKKWPLITFDEVTRVDAPMVDPRDDQYLDMLHIGPDRIEKNIGRILPALTAREERLISKKFLFNDSYVLYSKIRPYLKKAALPDFVGLCSADMYPIRPREGLMTREYLWQLLLSDEFTQYTESLPARASIPKLNRSELASFQFRLPPIDLQQKFSVFFRRYSLTLEANKSGSEVSHELFSSLSQRAFSGNLR